MDLKLKKRTPQERLNWLIKQYQEGVISFNDIKIQLYLFLCDNLELKE